MILFFLMPLVAAFALFRASKCKKRPALRLASAFFAFELIKTVLWLAGLKVSPALAFWIQTLPELLFVLCMLVLFRNDAPSVLVSTVFLILAAFSVVLGVFGALFLRTRTIEVDGVKYTGVYDTTSGVGQTTIDYHKNFSPLFVERKASFTDDYGVIFVPIDDEVLDQSDFVRTKR